MIEKIENTKLDGVKLITLNKFDDFRGGYIETYNEKEYFEKGIDIKFVQDDISWSSKHVLRGVHGDEGTYKLISCLHGNFYFVVVNNDPTHPQYKQWESFSLNAEKPQQVLVPPKFGNGHLIMSEKAIFCYKQSTYYDEYEQFTIKWNDPNYNMWWPVKNPIISQRDEGIK